VVDEVLGALFGGIVVAIEAGSPTLAAWLDGFVSAKLSAEPLVSAARANDVRRLLDAMTTATPAPPAELLPLGSALPAELDGASLTYPTGLQAVLFVEAPVFGVGTRRSVDVLPTAEWITAADDRDQGFARTLQGTSRLALAEAALFDTSTLSVLQGRPLTLLPAGAVAPRDGPWADHARLLDEYVSDQRLVPSDPGAFAFWVVRPDSGELLGILPDGSGGGSSVPGDHIIDRTAAAIGLSLSLSGFGFAAGAFVALQKAIAKSALVLAAWILTIGGEGEGGEGGSGDPNFDDILKGMGCDLAKSGLGATFPSYEVANKADQFGEMLGKPLLPCP
jgi:hypothetical protein